MDNLPANIVKRTYVGNFMRATATVAGHGRKFANDGAGRRGSAREQRYYGAVIFFNGGANNANSFGTMTPPMTTAAVVKIY